MYDCVKLSDFQYAALFLYIEPLLRCWTNVPELPHTTITHYDVRLGRMF